MNQLSKPNLLTAMISASISLALTGQAATAVDKQIPFRTLSTTGASATCRFAILDKAASLYCQISDTRIDGNKVYVEWEVDSFTDTPAVSYGDREFYHPGAANTTQVIQDRTSIPVNIDFIVWRVCRDVANTSSDNCSARVSAQ